MHYDVKVKITLDVLVKVVAKSEEAAYEKVDSLDIGYAKLIAEKVNAEKYDIEIYDVTCTGDE